MNLSKIYETVFHLCAQFVYIKHLLSTCYHAVTILKRVLSLKLELLLVSLMAEVWKNRHKGVA